MNRRRKIIQESRYFRKIIPINKNFFLNRLKLIFKTSYLKKFHIMSLIDLLPIELINKIDNFFVKPDYDYMEDLQDAFYFCAESAYSDAFGEDEPFDLSEDLDLVIKHDYKLFLQRLLAESKTYNICEICKYIVLDNCGDMFGEEHDDCHYYQMNLDEVLLDIRIKNYKLKTPNTRLDKFFRIYRINRY